MRLRVRRIFAPLKEANTIDDFKAVHSSLDISRSLKYYLSMCDHEKYGNDANVVRALNDTRIELCSVSRFKTSNSKKHFYLKSTRKPAILSTAMKYSMEEKLSTRGSMTKQQRMVFLLAFSEILSSSG